MSSQQNTLRYGDVVRIHGFSVKNDLQSSTDTIQQKKGIVLSKGFTDPFVYFLECENMEEVQHYRESLFQILPSIIERRVNVNGFIFRSKQRQAIRERANSELVTLNNAFEIQAKNGVEVVYYASIIFKHLETGWYLRGFLEAAQSGQGSFKLGITKDLSGDLIFKIKSHRTYEKEGNKVYLDDPLQIYHQKSDCYMNFDQSYESVFLDIKAPIIDFAAQVQCQRYIEKHPSIRKPLKPRVQIVNQNKPKCLWKFLLYQKYESFKNLDLVKTHDIIHLKYTEQKGGQIAGSYYGNEVYMKISKDQSCPVNYYNALWQTIPTSNHEEVSNTNYYLKNLISGKFMCLNSENQIVCQNDDNAQKVILCPMETSSKDIQNDALVNMMVRDKKIDADSIIPINKNLHQIIRSSEDKIQKYSLKLVNDMAKNSFKVLKLPSEQLRDIMHILSAGECISKFCEMIRSKPIFDKESKDPTRHVRSNPVFFSKLCNVLKQNYLDQVLQTFRNLICKVFGCQYNQSQNAGNSPNKQIQKIIVQTGLVELTVQSIYFLALLYNDIKSDAPDFKSHRIKMQQIFNDAYKLLQKIAMRFEDNRIYVSRWIDLIISHSIQINLQSIHECFVSILQNNKTSIQAMISGKQIIKLVSMFINQKAPSPKYLKLLSTFIRIKDGVIKTNQEIVLNNFFKNNQNPYVFRFSQSYKQKKAAETISFDSSELTKLGNTHLVMITYNNRQPLTIQKFFEMESDLWNYFIAYINLMADVCMNRNTESIQFISGQLSLKNVLIVLSDPYMKALQQKITQKNRLPSQLPIFSNVFEPFVRIAHHVYVDIKKFSQIRRIGKIFYWDQMNPDQDIPKTKRVFEGEKEQEEKKYLFIILDFIKKYLRECIYDPKNMTDMKALYTILDLLKVTVTQGLWTTVKQFRQLIPSLFKKIIKFDTQYLISQPDIGQSQQKTVDNIDKIGMKMRMSKNKGNSKLVKPETTLTIDCKKKAAQIFNLMIQMETSIRVNSSVLFFKKIYTADQNFQLYNKDQIQNIQDTQQNKQAIKRNSKARQTFFHTDKKQGLMVKIRTKKIAEQIILKQKIWLNKIKQLTPMQNDKLPEKQECRRYFFQKIEDFNILILSIFEISEYGDIDLLNSSISLIQKIFGQRFDLINNLKNVVLCGKGNFYEVNMKIKYIKFKLRMIQDPDVLGYKLHNSKQFSCQLWKPYDHTVKDQAKRTGIIQDIYFLSRILKQNANLKNIEALMTPDQDAFNQKTPFKVYNQRQQNDQLFQINAFLQQIHRPMFAYLSMITSKPDEKEDHYKLMRVIYMYLTLLAYNNLQNKQKLMPWIHISLNHLKYKVGAPNFIAEVCYNNNLLINDEIASNNIIQKLIQACDQFTIDDYQKSNILYALRSLALFYGKGNVDNQKKIVNLLQEKKHKKLIINQSISGMIRKRVVPLDFDINPKQTYLTTMFELFSVLVETKNSINIGKFSNIHNYTYLIGCLKESTYWQMRRTIRAYINRLYYVNSEQNIFLFEQFIRHQFTIICSQLNELVDLYVNHQHQNIYIKNGIRFSYAGSHTFLELIQILTTLDKMLQKPSFEASLKAELKKKQKNGDYSLHDNIFKICGNLGYIYTKRYGNDKKIPGSFIKSVLHTSLKPYLFEFDLEYLQKMCGHDIIEDFEDGVNDPDNQNQKKFSYDYGKTFFRNLYQMLVNINAKKRKDRLKKQLHERKAKYDGSQQGHKNKYIDLINTGKFVQNTVKSAKQYIGNKQQSSSLAVPTSNQYSSNFSTSQSKYFTVIAKPRGSDDEHNKQLNKKLKQVKDMISDSPIFNKCLDDQFIKLVTYFTQLDDISKVFYNNYMMKQVRIHNFDIPLISLDQIIMNMFQLTMKDPHRIQDVHKISIIKLVRCYISQAVESKQLYKLNVDKWDAEYFAGDDSVKAQLTKRQERIMNCGGAKFIHSILKLDLKLQVLNQILLLGIVFLFGGNTNCQNSLLQVLKQEQGNEMFRNLNNLIMKIGNYIYNLNNVKHVVVQKETKGFNHMLEDTYDFYNIRDKILEKKFWHESEGNVEVKVKKDHENILSRCFRFLQLLCENNNVEFKEYLLQQTANGKKKMMSKDFIQTACLLLRKFFKILSKKICKLPLTILDFMNETTQIPCLQNQKALTKSSYFEDLCYMASYFKKQQNRQNRQFTADNIDSLFQIYNKSIQLALSNLQGNDQNIYLQFIKKCQPEFLWQLVSQNLQIKVDQYYQDNKIKDKTLLDFDQEHFKIFIAQQSKKDKLFDTTMINILNIFIILKKVQDFIPNIVQKSQNKDQQGQNLKNKASRWIKQFKEAGSEKYENVIQIWIRKFNELLLQIEVATYNSKQDTYSLQNVYYPKFPVFNFLSQKTKDQIMFDVNRATKRDKLIGLLEKREEIFKQIEWNYDMNYKEKEILGFKTNIQITSDSCKNLNYIALGLSIFIMICTQVFTYPEHDVEQGTTSFEYNGFKSKILMRILYGLHLIATIAYVVVWVKLRKPLAQQKQVRVQIEQKQKKRKNEEFQVQQQEDEPKQGGFYSNKYVKLFTNIGQKIVPYYERSCEYFYTTKIYSTYQTIYCLAVHESQQFWPIVLFLIATYFGLFYGPAYFTIHIFDIFLKIPILGNVFKSITGNLQIIKYLSALTVVFIMVFNIVSLKTYAPIIYPEDMPDSDLVCQNLWDCIKTVYWSGAVGDQMDDFHFFTFVFNLLYVVFTELLLANLIGGVMIDGFQSLREHDDAINQDKINKCYICNNGKQNIDRIPGQTFQSHIKKHFLWNYVYYVYCLQNKDQTDYSGIQYQIKNKIQSDDITWFPTVDNADQQMGLEKKLTTFKRSFQEALNSVSDYRNQCEKALDSQMRIQSLGITEY